MRAGFVVDSAQEKDGNIICCECGHIMGPSYVGHALKLGVQWWCIKCESAVLPVWACESDCDNDEFGGPMHPAMAREVVNDGVVHGICPHCEKVLANRPSTETIHLDEKLKCSDCVKMVDPIWGLVGDNNYDAEGGE